MTEISVTQEGHSIQVTIKGTKDEPMRQDTRKAEATAAAKKHLGGPVSLLTGGGKNTPDEWELWYGYVPKGFRFAPRED